MQSFQRIETLSLVKAIANSSQGGNTAAVRAEYFAKLFYMGIDGTVIAEEIIAPDFIDEFFAGKGDSAVFYKEEEKVVFARGHIHMFSVNNNKSSGKINGKAFVLINFFGFRKSDSAAFLNCADPHHKFFRRKRLYNIVINAGFKTVNFIIFFAAGGKHYYRNI